MATEFFPESRRVLSSNIEIFVQRSTKHLVKRTSQRDQSSCNGQYVWFHLELQRKADPWMAVRMLAYTIAIHERAVREGRGTQKLPGVFPFVLSQSDRPWSAPRFIQDVIETRPEDPLWRLQPKFEYVVLEACRAKKHRDFPLLNGLLRAPYEPDDLSFVVEAVRGSKAIKNKAFALAFRQWMLNLAERLWPEEKKTMQQYYHDEEEVDVWEAWAQQVVAKRAQLERERDAYQRESEEASRREEEASRREEEASRREEEARRLSIQTLHTIVRARFDAQPVDKVAYLAMPDLIRLLQYAGTSESLEQYRRAEADIMVEE